MTIFYFFGGFCLRKGNLRGIVIVFMVCLCLFTNADEGVSAPGTVPRAGSGSGVNDADRPGDARRLRRELVAAEEALRRLELENEALRKRERELEAGLIEVKQRFQEQNESYRALQLWLAGVPAEGTVRKSGEREEQLLVTAKELSNRGGELALNAESFCALMRNLLSELPVGKVRQAELQLKLDSLSRDARRFIALTELTKEPDAGSDPLRTCRILAVNRELSVVILSVGSVKGAFAGMIYRTGKDRQIQLRVVAVRPYVAAAELVRGSIGDLAPGMEAAAGERKDADGR